MPSHKKRYRVHPLQDSGSREIGSRKNARAGRACGDQKDHGPPGMSWLMHCGTPRSCDTKLRLPCNRKAGGTHGPIFP